MANSIVSGVFFFTVATLLQILVVICDNDHGSHVVSYDSASFKEALDVNKNFVMFYAPWCGHCKNLAPTWNEIGKLYNKPENSPIIIGKVDCTVQTELCAEQEIIGFPTLKLFLTPNTVKRYAGKRDIDSLRSYVEGHLNAVDPQHDDKESVEGDESKPPVPEGKAGLVILTDENFKNTVSTGLFFIKFFAPWCGHCQKLAPVWDDLADTFKHTQKVTIAKVDCTTSRATCMEHGIPGYPTLLLFRDGEQIYKYEGGRSHEALKKFVSDEIAKSAEEEEEEEEEEEQSQPAGGGSEDGDEGEKGQVKELTADTFDSFLSTRLVFVKFFAPWCGHCKRLAPTWDDLAGDFADFPASIAKVDCTQHKSVCDSNNVRGYPTLKIFRNGAHVEDYRGTRSLEDLHAFVKKHLETMHDEF